MACKKRRKRGTSIAKKATNVTEHCRAARPSGAGRVAADPVVGKDGTSPDALTLVQDLLHS
jgi:hypothetical protein